MRYVLSLSVVLLLGGCASLRIADSGDGDAGDGTHTPDDPGSRPGGGASDDDDDDVTLPDGGKAPDAATKDASASEAGANDAKVESIAVGENVACVVFEKGVMRCWGSYLLAGGGSTSTPKPSPIPIRADDGGGFLTALRKSRRPTGTHARGSSRATSHAGASTTSTSSATSPATTARTRRSRRSRGS